MSLQIDIATGARTTFAELAENAEVIASSLIGQYGCRKGDVIALFAPNSIEWLQMALASFRIGAIPSGINSMLTHG